MWRIPFTLVLITCLAGSPVHSGDGCPLPPRLLPTGAHDLMSEEQENHFGEVFAEQLKYEFLVIEEDITENIRRIGRRLLLEAPPSGLRFRFYLVDYPEVNAFSLPGGKVYVTRKLVSACGNEDELAGVLAHEIGHCIARHPAANLSRLLRKVLAADPAADRKGAFDQYNLILDNVGRDPKVLKSISRGEKEDQIAADQISIYLAKKAGYRPEAYIQLWDRIQETGGNTGNFLSDLFGTTKPEQKRLRELQNFAGQLPAECEGHKPPADPELFREWQSAVTAYSGIGHPESLPEAERKLTLQPRLRGNITHMLFSRNGRYLLAQDSSGIFVLSRDPFKVLFRIDARSADPAQFTPDSASIVFSTSSLRVEEWDVARQQRGSVREMVMLSDCLANRLSPDGRHLACLDTDLNMILFDVPGGRKIFRKDFSGGPAFLVLGRLLLNDFGGMAFSPDGRYFVGTGAGADEHVAYDFVEDKAIKLPGPIRERLDRTFGFMSDGRFFGVKGIKGENAAIMSFPSGEILRRMEVGYGGVSPATHGDFLIVKPIQKYAAGVFDLAQNRVVMGSEQGAIDIFDRAYASERSDGVLSLFRLGEQEASGKVELPESPLPRPTAAALSSDLKWLAISEKSRGAIWNMETGSRTFLSRNFQEAHFAGDNTLVVDFPGSGEEKRMIVRIRPDEPSVVSSARLDEDRSLRQEGLYLVEWKTAQGRGSGNKTVLSVVDSLTGRELWVRDYERGSPWTLFSSDEDRAVFIWGASSGFVREEGRKDPGLKETIKSKNEREGDYYIQVLQASTGEVLHTMYVETGRGSFRLRKAAISGDYLTLYDNQNRLLVYSISGGERVGQIFGVNGSLSPAKPLLAAENSPGVLTVYSLPSMAESGTLRFGRPLVFVKFSTDGNKMFVLTDDQTAYLFDTGKLVTADR